MWWAWRRRIRERTAAHETKAGKHLVLSNISLQFTSKRMFQSRMRVISSSVRSSSRSRPNMVSTNARPLSSLIGRIFPELSLRISLDICHSHTLSKQLKRCHSRSPSSRKCSINSRCFLRRRLDSPSSAYLMLSANRISSDQRSPAISVIGKRPQQATVQS